MRWSGNAYGGAIVAFGLMGAVFAASLWQPAPTGIPTPRSLVSSPHPPPAATRAERARSEPVPLPMRTYLAAPFTSQAPFGNWGDPYGEACEEASAVMAVAWARGETLTPFGVDAEILNLVVFENYYFGYNHDTALAETARIITRYYGHAGAVVRYDIALDDIRRSLAGGNIVILPVAGALLANPHYIGPPPYHMVVVHGYDDTAGEFIVNDPGTRYGKDYRYPYATLWNAIHDWTGADETVANGRKGMIVVEPQARNESA